MRFLEGAPVFTVEIRSENDYGPKAERAIAEKRADYFTAGTLVVWDVDLLSPDVTKSYSANSPDTPKIFRRGDIDGSMYLAFNLHSAQPRYFATKGSHRFELPRNRLQS